MVLSAYSDSNSTEDCRDKHTEPGHEAQSNQVPARRRNMKLNNEIVVQEKFQVRLTQLVETHVPIRSSKDDLDWAI